MATMTMDVKSGYYVAHMHTWRLIVNDSNLGDKFPLDAAYTVSTLSIHWGGASGSVGELA